MIDRNKFKIETFTEYFRSRIIIDNILAWCLLVSLMITFIKYMFKVCYKYCLSFKLDKCKFYSKKAEFVDYDVSRSGNSPDHHLTWFRIDNFLFQIKCIFLNWTGHIWKKCTILQSTNKTFIASLKTIIPQINSTTVMNTFIIQLFQDIKMSILSTFLKTDWSSNGMAWLILLPENNKYSQETKKLLLKDEIIVHVDIWILSSLKKAIKIEIFNNTYFPSDRKTIQDPTIEKSSSLVD